MENKRPTLEEEQFTVEDLEEEKKLAQRITGSISINRLAMQEPDRVVQIMENRMRALETVRLGAIRNTDPYDWVLFRDKEGHETAILKKSGCVKIRKYFGISTLNVRPFEVQVKPNPEGGQTAEIWGDGICGLTGEMIVNVRGSRSSDEDFTGRGTLSDLKEAARTNLENKIARILGGMTAVPIDELKTVWAGTNKEATKIYKGMGFGKGKERSDRSSEPEITLETLGALILAIAKHAGKTEADLLMEATLYQKEGKKYWAKELSHLKEGWQIAKAHKFLIEKYGTIHTQQTNAQ